jgi:hypothetical protein
MKSLSYFYMHSPNATKQDGLSNLLINIHVKSGRCQHGKKDYFADILGSFWDF